MRKTFVLGLGIAVAIGAGSTACSGNPPSEKATKESQAVQRVEVAVEGGGYNPSTVEVAEGTPVELVFEMKEPSECLEEVVIDTANVRKKLTVGEKVPVRFDGLKKGVYEFHCGMNMASGKIVVK